MMKLTHWFVLSVCLFLSACVLTDRYDARAFQQLQTLETLSLRFINDAGQSPWDGEQLAQDDRAIRQGFSQAWMLAERLGDELRLDNLTILERSYSRLYTRVLARGKPLTPAQLSLYQQQTQRAWQLAMQGECLRTDSPCRTGGDDAIH